MADGWQQVISYSLYCALDQEKATVQLYVGDRKQLVQITACSLAHFHAMALLLQSESPLYFHRADSLLGTGPEPPGGSADQEPE